MFFNTTWTKFSVRSYVYREALIRIARVVQSFSNYITRFSSSRESGRVIMMITTSETVTAETREHAESYSALGEFNSVKRVTFSRGNYITWRPRASYLYIGTRYYFYYYFYRFHRVKHAQTLYGANIFLRRLKTLYIIITLFRKNYKIIRYLLTARTNR